PISTPFYRPDVLVAELAGLQHRRLAARVLVRELELGYSMQLCELLYKLALDLKQLDVAKDAATLCHAYEPTREARAGLASLLLDHGAPDAAAQTLGDVETW